jgi:hypothetical protein
MCVYIFHSEGQNLYVIDKFVELSLSRNGKQCVSAAVENECGHRNLPGQKWHRKREMDMELKIAKC